VFEVVDGRDTLMLWLSHWEPTRRREDGFGMSMRAIMGTFVGTKEDIRKGSRIFSPEGTRRG